MVDRGYRNESQHFIDTFDKVSVLQGSGLWLLSSTQWDENANHQQVRLRQIGCFCHSLASVHAIHTSDDAYSHS